ncbi:sphingosine-1-phosphate phosphatase 1-like [Styela clava]
MKSLIESLSSPHITAYFQRFCGVQWRCSDPDDPIFPAERLQNNDIKKSDEIIPDDYIIKNKIVYYAMQIGSHLAGEPFYYAFLPICSWMINVGVARKTLTKLALVMYIGQSSKDILRETRPSSPPVIRLEEMYVTEYGMPSTHTMAGTVAPFALYAFSRQIYQIPDRKCLIAATLWTTLVASSRIYLGMHSVWQVLVGSLGAGGILYFSISTVNSFDEKLVENSLWTAGMTAASWLLSVLIFRLDSGLDPETGKPRWNTARGDQAEIMGFCTGFLIGSRWSIHQHLYEYHKPYIFDDKLLPIPSCDLKDALIKFALGGLATISLSVIFRKISLRFFASIRGVSIEDKTQAKRHPKVELLYKYSTSMFSGVVCTTIIPYVLNELNLWQ